MEQTSRDGDGNEEPRLDPWTALALLAGTGDPDAANQLFGELLPWLHALARRFVRCDAEAWDIAQGTVIKCWATLPSFDPGRGNLRALAWTMLRNQAVSAGRLRARAPCSLGQAGDIGSSRDDPAARAEQGEEEGRAREALARLPPRESEALRLRLDGETYEEAARALAVPVGTVASRVFRARKSLREHLRGSEEESQPAA